MKLATSKTAAEDSGEGLLPGMGEDCGRVCIILNLSEKGSFIYLTMKNIWIYSRINQKGEPGRKDGKERKEQMRQQFLATACLVLLLFTCSRMMVVVGSCGSYFVMKCSL